MNQGNASGQQSRPVNDGSSSALSPTRGGTGKDIVPVSGGSGKSIRNNASDSHSQREEDEGNYVPGTSVVRIMKRVIPAGAKISDGAKETVQECVSEFICLITSEANERCQREHRKTVTPEDILYSLSKLGFDNYIQPLTLYINRYRELESGRSSVGGEPHVVRTVNYQHIQGTPPPPPPPAPLFYFNPQVAPPPLLYLFNPAEAMNGYQGYRVAPSGSTASAGTSGAVAYAPTPVFGGYYPYTAYPPPPPPPPGYYPGRQ